LEPQFELAQNVESKAGLSSADIAGNAGDAESGGNAALPRTVGRKTSALWVCYALRHASPCAGFEPRPSVVMQMFEFQVSRLA